MQGIVFNPHYMAYVDVALTEYWRAVGLPYPAAFSNVGLDIFMVAASQNYRDAARFDDEIDVHLRTDYLGSTSFRFDFDIRRGASLLVHGTATYVLGDQTSRAPHPLTPELVRAVEAFEPQAPARKSQSGTQAT